MPKSHYILCGPVSNDGTPSFWSNDNGWIEDETEATVFEDNRILTMPLPEGGTGILEYVDGEAARYLAPLPMGLPETMVNL